MKTNGSEAMDDGALAQLFNPKALEKLRGLGDAAKREAALVELLAEFKQAVSDLVAHIEESDPKATADRLAAAIAALKFPVPQVTVQAPNITLEANIPPAPAPVVHLIDRPASDETWEIRIKSAFGNDKVMTITRKTAPAAKPKRIE